MINEIKYRGYTAQPSDYNAPDGDLAFSLNLINENGYLSPIPVLFPSLKLLDGEQLVIIHTVENRRNYILLRDIYDADESKALYWISHSNDLTDTANATFVTIIPGFRDVVIMGNTLIFATDKGMRYLLWKKGTYLSLGSRPPFLIMDFGLKYKGRLASSETFIDVAEACVGDGASSGISRPTRRHKATKEDLADITQRIYAQLLSAVNETIIANGYFYQPFFIRYAYRLYDGTHAWHSAPILMLPTVTVPRIDITSNEAGSEAGLRTVGSQLNIPYFILNHNIEDNQLEDLKAWSDIVTAIDVFISAPIYTFDQSKDLDSATISLQALYAAGTTTAVSGGNNANRGRSKSNYLLGHYAEAAENSRYIDHLTSETTNNINCWNVRWHERFLENIKSVHDFYKIAEIDISELAPTEGMQPLNLTTTDLTNLVTRPTLSDDYISHATLTPKTLLTFNSRLNITGVDFTPAAPLPIRASVEYGNAEGDNTDYTITVWSRHNGITCQTIHKSSITTDKFNVPTGCPRYIFYPDANAFKMEIRISDTLRYTLPLTPHDFLNGAYYFGGILADRTPPDNSEETDSNTVSSVSMPSKIYTSEVNNPFIFPPEYINTVGTGTVFALSSAAKALSQGQFGQFPLYAFTSEGIWAMEISETGSFRARQPITRDVCRNTHGITQIDSAVLFPSDRGIMLISGAEAICISDDINSDTPFDISQLPQMNTMAEHCFADSILPVQPFTIFLKNCRMIYDYAHQRVIIYNEEYDYAYIYSLRTRLWGMMSSAIKYDVNSYPYPLAVSRSNELIDFACSDSYFLPSMLLSRPLKLDAPDLLKTIDTIIQRGNFRKGHVQVILYGSRDLYDWSLIWSSKDHYLRGFRGSPYKYFRIALLCHLDKDESISGATIQYTPRLTNQPR